jgi:hypothetical protein
LLEKGINRSGFMTGFAPTKARFLPYPQTETSQNAKRGYEMIPSDSGRVSRE